VTTLNDLKGKIAKAKNSLASTAGLFDQKVFYYGEVFPNGKSPWPVQPIDLINENPLYGRVDMNKEFVFPKEEMLRTLSTGPNNNLEELSVLNFVADAYDDLKLYITAHVNNGYIKPSGIIAKCNPHKSYYNIEKAWKKYRQIHYGLYTLQYLKIASGDQLARAYPLQNKIFDESDFIEYFNIFMKDSIPFFPLSMSGLVVSNNLSPLFTGLCIEIHNGKYDDDKEKQKFINHPNFSFFQLAARKHGFFLDRNVPWRLVADLTSHKMREYARIAFERPLLEEATEEVYKERLDSTWQKIFGSKENVGQVLDEVTNEKLNSYTDNIWQMPSAQMEGGIKVLNDIQTGFEAKREAIEAEHSNKWETIKMAGSVDPITELIFNQYSIPIYTRKIKNCTEQGKNLPTMCDSRVFVMDAIFEEFFEKISDEEMLRLEETMLLYYKTYIVTNPTVKIIKTVGCSEKGFGTKVVKEIERKDIAETAFKEKYGDMFWLKFYLDVRLLENKIKWSAGKYSRVLKKAYGYFKILDTDTAFRYINKEIKKRLIGYENIYKDEIEQKKKKTKHKLLGSSGLPAEATNPSSSGGGY